MSDITEIVVSVHGVESTGDWHERVIAPGFDGIAGLIHKPHNYGKFRAWKVFIGPLRNRQIRKFYKKIDQFHQQHPDIRPSVVAHSFGTYIVTRALARYPAIKLNRLVLCGSIVERAYDWKTMLESRRVHGVRNEVAGDDPVVRLFRSRVMRRLVPYSGPTGIDGFGHKYSGFEEATFKEFSHCSHFEAPLHCKTFWVPYIRGTQEFSDLCRQCADSTNPNRAAAYAEFSSRYDSAIAAAVDVIFHERSQSQRDDYVKLLRHDIIRDGAAGRAKFEESCDRKVRALNAHVR